MDKSKIIIFAGLCLIVIIIIIVIAINPFKQTAPAPVTLEFWSVFDGSDIYAPLIQKYQQLYPHVTINYYKKDITTYEKELIDALAAGRGPDVFSVHNTWLPKHQDKLAAAPEGLVTPARFREIFVDAANQDLVAGNKVYAFPLSVDSLALFYNRDLFNAAGVAAPPASWEDFNAAVEKLTKRDAKKNIFQAGAALGTAKNINRSTDILALLMLQGGAKMVSDDKKNATFDQYVSAGQESFNPGKQALIFYTNFANPNVRVYTWNGLQHYSLDAFAEGRAAMMLNYSYQIETLRGRAPHLNFGVAPVPQISNKSGHKTTFANYWAQAASKGSVNQAQAWQFIAWLSSQENSRAYLQATQKPAARRDLLDEQKNDFDLAVFAGQALYAKTWWEIDNLAIETTFAEMIESVVAGRATVDDALSRARTQVTEMMGK